MGNRRSYRNIKRGLPIFSSGNTALYLLILLCGIITTVSGQPIDFATFNASNVTLTPAQVNDKIVSLDAQISRIAEQGIATSRFEDAVDQLADLGSRGKYGELLFVEYQTVQALKQTDLVIEQHRELTLLLDIAVSQALSVVNSELQLSQAQTEIQLGNAQGAQTLLNQVSTELLTLLTPRVDHAHAKATSIVHSTKNTSVAYHHISLVYTTLDQARRFGNIQEVFVLGDVLAKLNQSNSDLTQLQQDIADLEAKGYNVDLLKDLIVDLERALNNQEFDSFALLLDQAQQYVGHILPLDQKLTETEQKLHSSLYEGIDLTQAVYYANLSRTEFVLGNYERAQSHQQQAESLLATIEQDHLVALTLNKSRQRFDYVAFVQHYWWALILVVSLGAYLSGLSYYALRSFNLKRKLHSLDDEEQSVISLIKKVQLQYFKDHEIDKETYGQQSAHYERRLTGIREEIPLTLQERTRIEHKLSRLTLGLYQSKATKNFSEEVST